MNGIRLSPPFLQAEYFIPSNVLQSPIYHFLALGKINLAFLCVDNISSPNYISCCMEPEFIDKIDQSCDSYYSPMHTVSVYPHKYSLNALGKFLHLSGKNTLPFTSFVSSNSMFTVVIDDGHYQSLADSFKDNFDLPKTHTPFEHNINRKDLELLLQSYPETCAAYVEDKIKTYGFKVQKNLDLFHLILDYDNLDEMGNKISRLEESGACFYFALGHTESDNQISLFFITDPLRKETARFIQEISRSRSLKDLSITNNMELITFQGPHFGDRYGIADKALTTLSNASIPVLLAGCTGACICLVFSLGMASKAINALSLTFEKP